MKQTYILAVSGGVDSVVLLHKLASLKPEHIRYIVAHVDHGIRSTSAEDADFVKQLADKWGYEYEQIALKLGAHASEALARKQRYDFLFAIKKRYKAEMIITAHHQDDVLETMILNMLRGTSPRGLVGFRRAGILRPFVQTPKAELVRYAESHGLAWREDETNNQTNYLRNYVRTHIIPRMSERRAELLAIRETLQKSYIEIDMLSKSLLVQSIHRGQLVRSRFVILPLVVQHEMLAQWLRLNGVEFDRELIRLATLAIKTYKPNKCFEIHDKTRLVMDKKTILLKNEGGTV